MYDKASSKEVYFWAASVTFVFTDHDNLEAVPFVYRTLKQVDGRL